MSSTRQEPVGYAPGSLYASLDTDERATLDEAEREHNLHSSAVAALADQVRGHTVHGMSDRMLADLYKHAAHEIETALQAGDTRRARLLRTRQCDITREMALRGALAECWLAVEDGTCSYTAFQARGGLAAVAEHGAPPPSYTLAILLDFEHHRLGLSCVLAWGEVERNMR